MTGPRDSSVHQAICLIQSLILVTSLITAAGCTLDDLHHDGRYCSADYPCSAGFACVGQACVATATSDSSPPVDAIKDGPRDGPAVDRGPGKEGGADKAVADSAADTSPMSDLGCTGGKIACGGACIDPFTDTKHCGGCDKPCPASGDRCQQGKCHCGDFKPLCQGGLNCSSGACSCLVGPGSLCGGCCASNLCHPGTSISLCGVGGAACKSCSVTGSCLTPTCSAGLCGDSPRPDGYPCPGGRCYAAACCVGCYDTAGNSCRSGTALLYCGTGGLPCKNCKAIGSCVNQTCKK
jgi:hypothetical protein